jgi:hypothetical protein
LLLCEQDNFSAALPLLEKLAEAHPSDPVVLEKLGAALVGTEPNTSDPEARKQIFCTEGGVIACPNSERAGTRIRRSDGPPDSIFDSSYPSPMPSQQSQS